MPENKSSGHQSSGKADRNGADPAERRARLGRAIATTAPHLAEALGGPLAGAAIGAITRAILGDGPGDDARLEEVVLAGAPETLVRLREAEIDFRKAVLAAAGASERIAMEDRASARARQSAMKDRAPTLIGTAVIGGFFAVLAVMLIADLPAGLEAEFSIMLGALATMTAAVVNYFFGSSAGSREKTQFLVDRSGSRSS